jgi:carbohydrate diacid regulator
MSGRIFQSVIVQMKEATERVIGVMDSDGGIVACNELSLVGSKIAKAAAVIAESATQVVVFEARTFKVLGGWNSNFDTPFLSTAPTRKRRLSAYWPR